MGTLEPEVRKADRPSAGARSEAKELHRGCTRGGGCAKLALTLRAEPCAAPALGDPPDHPAVIAPTCFIRPVIYVESRREISQLAIGLGVIAQGRATVPDRGFQHFANCRDEPRKLGFGDFAAALARVNARAPKCLTYIYIAEPSDDPLIQQAQFDRLGLAFERLFEMLDAKTLTERLWPKAGKGRPLVERFGRDKVNRTEPARIAQSESVRVGFDNQMVMLVVITRIDPPASAHAQMEDHRLPAIDIDQAVFRASIKTSNRGSCHHLYKLWRERAAQIRTVQLDPRNPLTQHKALKAADGGFNFWQFRHQELRLTSFAHHTNFPKALRYERKDSILRL